MEEGENEGKITGYPTLIPYECNKKIIEQMEKTICKMKIGAKQGTGFFCKIPFPNKNNMLRVLITNNHIIDDKYLYKKDEELSLYIHAYQTKKIDLNNRIKYTNKEYDLTIIEIKDEDKINDYLKLDKEILNDIINNTNNNEIYKDKTMYIIQYPDGDLSVSFGILNGIYEDKKYNILHKCETMQGSSGSPILNLKTNKIIGIHKKGCQGEYNFGTFLNYPIKDFIKQHFNKVEDNKQKNKGNEIKYEFATLPPEEKQKLIQEKKEKNISLLILLNNIFFKNQTLTEINFEKIDDKSLEILKKEYNKHINEEKNFVPLYVTNYIQANVLKIFEKNIKPEYLNLIKNKISLVLKCVNIGENYFKNFKNQIKNDGNIIESYLAAAKFRKEFNISESYIKQNALIQILYENNNDIKKVFQLIYGK